MSFERLAIVNRGEAAMRCLHAVAELQSTGTRSLTSIALYTDPDAGAWFVREADEAVHLGPATYLDAAEGRRKITYLNHDLLIEALVRARAEAVWVGWGFVAEHAAFAQRCEEAGITFVGPPSAVIRRLGDKVASKRLAEGADVPVVPWSGGPVDDVDSALEQAERLGYPVVLKASAGGGGRGIRMIADPEDLPYAFESARTEAEHGFGDPTVFLEQRVGAARHVEVQAIADHHGTVWAVGVRDCSVQRRNQKVLEESASTALDAETEAAIKDAAVRLCQAADYRNAGTVEFLYDPQTQRYLFMEVNTRLQVEHPATELVTGLDLVKLQLHVAAGGRLEGTPPPSNGHAIEARLNAEDPEQNFSPAPGRIVAWRPPTGPGVRVETGVTDGDTIAPEFDSMIAKILTWGRDRDEALARLRRALMEAVVVVEGGMTNKAFLLGLLDRPEIKDGQVDTAWLDRLTAAGDHLPRHRGIALLYAAIEAYEADRAADQAAFYQGAARGRPELPAQTGYGVDLRFRGQAYHFDVYCTGPGTYRVGTGDAAVVVSVVEQGTFERRITIGGQDHRVVAHAEGPSFQVEVNGIQHRISRDEGGLVRADAPALVVSVKAEPDQEVAPGDPLIVLESMKMERTLTAPFGGRVRAVLVGNHVQVDPGTPLLQIDPHADEQEASAAGARMRFDDLPSIAEPASPDEARARLFAELRSYLLGYDLDPASVRRIPAAMSAVVRALPAGDEALFADEREILEIFAEVGALFRRHPTPELDEPGEILESTQEHLLTYLAWLDAERSGVPQRFLDRLTKALQRYGVTGLEQSPELLAALFWMYRSFVRVGELAPMVAAILDRHAHAIDALDLDVGYRELLDRMVAAAEGRHQEVSDLAREVRFRAFDQPVMDRARNEVYAEMRELLDELERGQEGARRDELVQRLVWCHQPLRAMLRDRYRSGDERMREQILEINTRRFYRIRHLENVRTVRIDGQLLGLADYSHRGSDIHLVTAYGNLDDLSKILAAIRAHLDDVDDTRLVVVGLATWRAGDKPDADTMAALARDRLQEGWVDGRALRRVDVTVTSTGQSPEHERTQHATFRHVDGTFTEEVLYRNLHPMLAKRLELWRLDNFNIVRQASAEDVYVFHATARANPEDQRLIALAEVRDLTPLTDDAGRIVALPHLERMVMEALTAIRQVQAGRPVRRRLLMNRIVLIVRPPWDIPPELWRELTQRIAPATSGLGLEKVVVTVQMRDRASGELRPAVLHVENIAVRGVTVRLEPPGAEPIRELSAYGQKVLKSRRIGAPYPYELVRMLTPASGTTSDFPSGDFVEHDLDDRGERLVPVERPYGENRAGVVVGVIRNVTTKVPEGMRRVLIAGDPSRSLGSLAEAECRRINAAIDLAEELGVPVEWFALSSGARIAMDSGTENMDWIGAVLRRIIEFTQAGGEINVVVTGINVGAQPYWNAEATMLMHTRGILVMTPQSAMVLTGKQSLDFSGGVSAEDNFGIGGYERIMGPNGQAQYWAANVEGACMTLFRHYEHTYVVPGERFPRRAATDDPANRDVREAPHAALEGTPFTRVGDIFSADLNGERKHAFDIRSVMRAVSDLDHEPLERWARWRNAEMAVAWDAHVGGFPVSMVGIESHNVPRKGFVPADGPPNWTSGTLFPQASRKVARAINAASGNRPVVVLANLSGFDGSPESMRKLQLEFGAEIGRAVTNFDGPIIFTVVSRYHGGAFVVFAKTLNDGLEIAAVEGSYASVIGGAPAAGVVFAREVRTRTERDPRLAELRASLAGTSGDGASSDHSRLDELRREVHAETLARVAAEFDAVHSIQRALRVGSVDRIIAAHELRPYVIDAVERGVARVSVGDASERVPTG